MAVGFRAAVVAIACLAAASMAAGKELTNESFLRTNGGLIKDHRGKGEAVKLRGVNLGGWLVMEGWMCPMDSSGLKDDFSVRETLEKRFGRADADKLMNVYEDAYIAGVDLDHIAALGMNLIRVPFWYRNLEDEHGTWLSDAFERLDWVVNEAAKRGIYTILDFHGMPGGQSDKDHTGRERTGAVRPDFFTSDVELQRGATAWSRIAAHFKGNPGVAAYDLMNEPTGAPSREKLWAAYALLYQKVRAADPEHIIAVEGCWGGQVAGKYMGWGWDVLPSPQKSGWTNVMYEFHAYEWSGGDLAKQKRQVDAVIEEFERHKKLEVPCYLGEFNCMSLGEAWQYALDRYTKAGVHWTIWSYKATHGSGEDSWGVYNPRRDAPDRPDIQHDALDVIEKKWKAWTDDAFEINPMIVKAVEERGKMEDGRGK